MKTKHTLRSLLIALLSSLAIFTAQVPVAACTRALYVAKDGTVLTGRSMDWGEDMHSNMWVLPRGMKRDGGGGKNTVTWESKYGSLVVSAYDIGTCDGMNEKGLVVNMLALVESDYGKPAEGGKVICMSTWAQYILDNHATVAEAVADLRKEEFRVQTIVLPTGRPANMHLAISDATGDSAIFEYVNGKLVIHHGKQFKVLTNSPTYDQQLAIMEYWKLAGGLTKIAPRHFQRRRPFRPRLVPARRAAGRDIEELHHRLAAAEVPLPGGDGGALADAQHRHAAGLFAR